MEATARRKRLISIAILFFVYFIAGKLGLRLGTINHYATLIWLPSGISLATLVISGIELWPAVALAALLVNWTEGAPLWVAFFIAAGNTLEAVVGAYLLRRVGFQRSLERLEDVFYLIFFGAAVSTLISAAFGAVTLKLAGLLGPKTFSMTWAAWWLGDAVSDLTFASFLMTWFKPAAKNSPGEHSVKTTELLAFFLLIVCGSLFIFTDFIPPRSFPVQRPYFIFPILMFLALRLNQRWITASILFLSSIILVTTALGLGRFWTGSLSRSLLEAQIFIGVVSISKLVLSATVLELRRERETLRKMNFQIGESNAEREAILNSALDCIVTIDHDGMIREFNSAAEKLFGFTRDEVMGKEMASLIIPPRLRESHRNGLARYIATGEGPILRKRVEMPAVHRDGSEMPVELSIVPLRVPGLPRFTGFMRDITERRRRTEAQSFLAETTRLLSESIDYKTTLKHVAQAAVPKYADFCVVFTLTDGSGPLEPVELTSAIPEQEKYLREMIETYYINPHEPALVAAAIRTGQCQLVSAADDETYRKLATDDKHFELLKKVGFRSLIGCPLIYQDRVLGAIALGSNRSNRYYDTEDTALIEEVARRAAISIENARLYREARDAIYMRDEFLSIASHELKTPLTALSLQLQMFNRGIRKILENKKKDEPPVENITLPFRSAKLIASCEEQSKKLSALLEELLDLTRIRLGRLVLDKETFDLCALAQEVVNRFQVEASEKGSSISIDCEPSITGNWDRIRIEQVVTNLISNAIKYGEHKPFAVTLERIEARAGVKMSVRDHGMGIPPEMQNKIFQRFERAGAEGGKISGLGLGLYICRQIVEAHGGSIRVESEVGQGATFTVELPLEHRQTGELIPIESPKKLAS